MSYPLIKRGIDVTLASIGLVATLPISLAAAATLFVQNRGDVFFTQKRIGKNGKEFDTYKFKTMRDDCDENGNLLCDAARVTPFGKFMRQHVIDEIPQLINIFKGEMSFVGPRPLPVNFIYSKRRATSEWLDQALTAREAVLPGFFCFHKAETEGQWAHRLATDAFYAKHQSFQIDMDILCHVLKKGTTGRNNTNDKNFAKDCLEAFMDKAALNNPAYSPDTLKRPFSKTKLEKFCNL